MAESPLGHSLTRSTCSLTCVYGCGAQLPRPTWTITPHAPYLHFCDLQVYVAPPWRCWRRAGRAPESARDLDARRPPGHRPLSAGQDRGGHTGAMLAILAGKLDPAAGTASDCLEDAYSARSVTCPTGKCSGRCSPPSTCWSTRASWTRRGSICGSSYRGARRAGRGGYRRRTRRRWHPSHLSRIAARWIG